VDTEGPYMGKLHGHRRAIHGKVMWTHRVDCKSVPACVSMVLGIADGHSFIAIPSLTFLLRVRCPILLGP
jgi:hypothetical protein